MAGQSQVCQKPSKTKTFRLYLCTWNVAGNVPPKDLSDVMNVLDLKTKPLPDAYAIGLQEASNKSTDVDSHPWTVKLTDVLSVRGYVRVKGVHMQGMLLLLFVKTTHLLHMTNIESEYTRTGLAGFWGNKGGVSIRMDVNGINTCIVNCHLAAHLEYVADRIEDFSSIVEQQKFRDEDVDNILDHDYVFWIGDLNFRLDELSREEVLKRIQMNELEKLWPNDQLNKCRQEGVIFLDFEEGPLNFPPTYKFDPGTDTYDTERRKKLEIQTPLDLNGWGREPGVFGQESFMLPGQIRKLRKPAWCDRILWMVHDDAFDGVDLGVKQISYDSHPACKFSDHKPVTSLFNIVVLANPLPTPVSFRPISRWYKGTDATVQYTVRRRTDVSNWDWIGLYQSNFRDFKDYCTYVWADSDKDKQVHTVTFSGKYLTKLSKYRLCYISSTKDTLLGMSEEFELAP